MGKKLTIEEILTIAEQRGGKCLSEKYIDNRTKLKWQCKKGHIWEAIPNSIIQQNSWCPYCAGSVRLTLEQMKELAKKKNGLCLSKEYVNNRTKLRWQCKEGHIWETAPYSIKDGKWCPYCAGTNKLTIEEMQMIAEERGGKCLSGKYINTNTKLKWQCKEGHIWEAKPCHIKQGEWCPKCARVKIADALKGNIKEYQKIAKSRGGLCLSTNYVNAHRKLTWQCKEGHIWEATPGAIKYGRQWCPKCSENISERICRKMFENIFNEKFPKRHPKWLLSQKGKRMELDGYCQKLGIAFEYQGIQHYEYIPRFHKTRSFDRQKTMDELKRKKCAENNVILIEVPYVIDYENMPKYIIQECKKRNVEIPEITKSLDYKLMNIYSPEKLKEMQEIAIEKGGLCLSKKYINNITNLKWQCKDGHEWEATPSSIKSGSWCHCCAGNLRLNIEQMQDLAKKKGGLCLSEEYINNQTKLRWQCREGHEWEATGGSIKAGSWCPVCGGTAKLSLHDMQNLAERKQGTCLSTEYVNAHTKLMWQCKEGHTWKAKPDCIQQGRWCPYCAGVIKLTIEQMQDLAKKRGGICLSKEYIDTDTKLKWQCKEGHIWDATPYHIKNRESWCPKCGIMRTANLKRKTIEEMQELARKKDGKCLSENYVHTHSKLTWQCKEGHTWDATPHMIKRGTWCPDCFKINKKLGLKKYNRNYKQFPHKNIF